MNITMITKNFDLGLIVAVISLVFTAVVSFITIRYTKKSLEYTKQSVDIANESLNAAKKSIDTSIEIYEKQKKDSEIEFNARSKDKLFAIKSLILNDVLANRISFGYMVDFLKRVIKDDVIDLKINSDDPFFASYRTRNFVSYGVSFAKHESSLMEKHLLDIFSTDNLFAAKLMALIRDTRRYNDMYMPKIKELVNDKGDEDHYKLYCYIKKCEKFICEYHESIIDTCRDCLDINTN